jgi:hypothetical protein
MGPSLLNGTSSASRTDLAPAASDSATGEKGRPAVDKAMPAMGERRAVKRNVAPWRKQQQTGEEGTAVGEAAATAEDIYEFSGTRYRYLRVRSSSNVDPHHVDEDTDSTYHDYADPDSDLYLVWIRIRIRLFTLMRIRIQILTSKEKHRPLKKCSNRLIFHTFRLIICKLMRIRIQFRIQSCVVNTAVIGQGIGMLIFMKSLAPLKHGWPKAFTLEIKNRQYVP